MTGHLMSGMVLIIPMVFIHGVGSIILPRLIVLYEPFWERHGTLWINTLASPGSWASSSFSTSWRYGLGLLIYDFRGIPPGLETSACFSLQTYTTLCTTFGCGDVILPKSWRLLGGCGQGAGANQDEERRSHGAPKHFPPCTERTAWL